MSGSLDPKQINIDPLHPTMAPLRDNLAEAGYNRSLAPQQPTQPFANIDNIYRQLYTAPMSNSYMTPPQQPSSMFSNALLGLLGTLLFKPNQNPGLPGPYTPPPAGGGSGTTQPPAGGGSNTPPPGEGGTVPTTPPTGGHTPGEGVGTGGSAGGGTTTPPAQSSVTPLTPWSGWGDLAYPQLQAQNWTNYQDTKNPSSGVSVTAGDPGRYGLFEKAVTAGFVPNSQEGLTAFNSMMAAGAQGRASANPQFEQWLNSSGYYGANQPTTVDPIGNATTVPNVAIWQLEQKLQATGTDEPEKRAALIAQIDALKRASGLLPNNPVPAPVQVPAIQTSQQTFQPVQSGSRYMGTVPSDVSPTGITRFRIPEELR